MKIFRRGILLIVITVLLIIIVLGVANCSENTIAGLYVDEDNPRVFLHLQDDGKFTSVMGFSGSWQVDGNEVMLISPLGLETLRIEGDKLIDSKGKILVKKGK